MTLILRSAKRVSKDGGHCVFGGELGPLSFETRFCETLLRTRV